MNPSLLERQGHRLLQIGVARDAAALRRTRNARPRGSTAKRVSRVSDALRDIDELAHRACRSLDIDVLDNELKRIDE